MEVDEKFWKEVESFGKFLFRKGCFLFFRPGARSRRSRPAQALAKRCTFDLTVSCHGQLVHFRSRRGRGPPVHAVDRVHRLEHAAAAVITRTVKTSKKADGMLLIVAFPDLGPVGRSISLRFSDRRGSPYSKWESASFQRCGFLTTGSSLGFRLSLGKMTALAVRCVVSTLTFRTWE